MAVVVTGAAGFLGAHVVPLLRSRGHHVVALDRRPTPSSDGVTALTVDVLDDLAADAIREADAVVHLAGRPGVRDRSPEADRLRYRDNVLATAAVLTAARPGAPVVVTSSSSVYGGSRDGTPCRESDLLRPLGGYARSKAVVERLCADRRGRGGAVAVARPFTVVGEGQRPDMALARWIAAARSGAPVTVLGSASRTRDVTDVRDVARGLVALLEREVDEVVNLGTGVGHTLAALLAAVCAELAVPVEVQLVEAGTDEPADTLADTRRCERRLGFRPTTDLRDVVRRQVSAGAAAPAADVESRMASVPS